MQRKVILGLAASVACATAIVGAPFATAGVAPASVGVTAGPNAMEAVGLTADQRLVRFNVTAPERTQKIGRVSGLVGDTALVGIDYRVQTNLLYGVGNSDGVYTLNETSGAATKVSQLSVALSGTSFGVDFNPAADRLRVISDTGQNLRHDLTLGVTTVDIGLTYPPATTPALGLTAAAYTNNDLDPTTATTLFDVDTNLNQIALQSPANNGTLAGTGLLTVDAGADAGFDIYSRLVAGATVEVSGFATLQVNGVYRLYNITLLSGKATDAGAFPTSVQVMDLALPLNQG